MNLVRPQFNSAQVHQFFADSFRVWFPAKWRCFGGAKTGMPKTEKYGVMAQLVARLREGSPTLCGFPQNGVVMAEPKQECLKQKYGVMAQLVARLREGYPTLCGFPQNGVVLAKPKQECLKQKYGVMAQLVARLNGIQKVTSSNLVSSTTGGVSEHWELFVCSTGFVASIPLYGA